MEIIYRANDGMEFTNEQDCINHENVESCICDKKHFIAFNSDFKPYDITQDSIEDALETMEYFICLTDAGVDAFNTLYNRYGYCSPVKELKARIYYGWEVENIDQWDAFSNVWEVYNQRFNRLMRIEDALNKSVAQARGE